MNQRLPALHRVVLREGRFVVPSCVYVTDGLWVAFFLQPFLFRLALLCALYYTLAWPSPSAPPAARMVVAAVAALCEATLVARHLVEHSGLRMGWLFLRR